jgi:hypothetical protein
LGQIGTGLGNGGSGTNNDYATWEGLFPEAVWLPSHAVDLAQAESALSYMASAGDFGSPSDGNEPDAQNSFTGDLADNGVWWLMNGADNPDQMSVGATGGLTWTTPSNGSTFLGFCDNCMSCMDQCSVNWPWLFTGFRPFISVVLCTGALFFCYRCAKWAFTSEADPMVSPVESL